MKALVGVLVSILMFSLLSAAVAAENGGGNDKGPLSKITYIHWKNAPAKPPWAGGGKNNESSCYAFISNGAKWKANEPYAINPTNADGLLNASEVVAANAAGVAAWEAQSGDVLGNWYVDYNASYNDDYTDNVNSISFGYYPNSGVIAITTVWGYFYGPPPSREIIEFDLLYNDPYYVWGNADVDPSVMDLQNIATHELGHALGLSDLYTSGCTEETMYGYSSEGEMKKRTLGAGDIVGIKKLYG